MNELEFSKFLKKKGKQSKVVDRNIREIKRFNQFLQDKKSKDILNTISEDIEEYVSLIEKEKQSAKGPLYVLMNYFKYTREEDLYNFSKALREERTKSTRYPFLLKNFLGVNHEYTKILATHGIKNVNHMLKAGQTKQQREILATTLHIPEEKIFEIVKLSDITRIGHVKAKLARLYYNAGVDSPEKISQYEPQELHRLFEKYIKESGWDGMVPNPADLVNNINNAKKLKKIVEL